MPPIIYIITLALISLSAASGCGSDETKPKKGDPKKTEYKMPETGPGGGKLE